MAKKPSGKTLAKKKASKPKPIPDTPLPDLPAPVPEPLTDRPPDDPERSA